MKKVPGWRKIEIVCVIIVVAFMSFLIGIYYQSRTEGGSIRSLCSGWYQMKDGKRIELELPCSVTADAEEKVIFGGRLGEYKYYDMDQVIAAVLEKCENVFGL